LILPRIGTLEQQEKFTLEYDNMIIGGNDELEEIVLSSSSKTSSFETAKADIERIKEIRKSERALATSVTDNNLNSPAFKRHNVEFKQDITNPGKAIDSYIDESSNQIKPNGFTNRITD
jgi:hypothetical protein